jgi:hypothetical protein
MNPEPIEYEGVLTAEPLLSEMTVCGRIFMIYSMAKILNTKTKNVL